MAKLRAFVVALFTFHAENLIRIGVFFSDFRSLNPERQEAIIRERDRYDKLLRDVIRQGQEEEVICPDLDPKVTALAILGMVNWIHQWYKPGGGRSARAIAEAYADFAARRRRLLTGDPRARPPPPARRRAARRRRVTLVAWHPRISVNEECAGFSLPFAEEVDFWKALGVDDIGVISPKLEAIGWDTVLVDQTGLRVSNIGTEERVLMEALEFGAALGSDSVWITPGGVGPRTWEEAAADFCERIAPAVARAGELGIDFALEPTNSLRFDISFVFNLRDSLELAKAAGMKVVLELACCWYERGLEQLVRENRLQKPGAEEAEGNSPGRLTAVDDDDAACHERPGGGREQGHRTLELLGGAEAPHRDAVAEQRRRSG